MTESYVCMCIFTYLYMVYLKMEKNIEGTTLIVNLDFLYVCVGGGDDADVEEMQI